jgi:hypothetical protein
VPEQSSFDYAVIRVVPRVDREEFINAGVIVFCPELQFLEARIYLDDARAKALWPTIDLDIVRRHLQAFPDVCSADPAAGPIAKLTQRERFHWLVSPRSTMIQVSPVHCGVCDDAAKALEHLCTQLLHNG